MAKKRNKMPDGGKVKPKPQGNNSESYYSQKHLNAPNPFKNSVGEPIKNRDDFSETFPWDWARVQGAGGERRQNTYGPLGDLYRYYAGVPLKDTALSISQYQPKNSKDKNAKYIAINDPKFEQEVLDKYKQIFLKKDLDWNTEKKGDSTYSVSGYTRPTREDYTSSNKGDLFINKGKKHYSNAIGNYYISKGSDENGDYISYYDVFDAGTGKPENTGKSENFGLTKPFEIYNRIYIDPKTGEKKNIANQAKALPQINTYENGGEINMAKDGFKINPKHKGWCTPMTKSTCTGKRKQFAINAKNQFKKQGEDGLELDPIDLSNHPKWLDTYQDPYPSFPGFKDDNTLAPVNVNDARPPRPAAQLSPIDNNIPMVNKTLDKDAQLQIAQNTPQEKKKFDWGWLNSENLLTGLSAIDALIPGKKNKTNYLTPADQIWSNPNPYGTGSSALMENGGDLSPEKAKEMLKNPPRGKKLTAKQKRYFQGIAHGMKDTAPNGASLSKKKAVYNPESYKPFGNQNQQAFEEGWMPITSGGGVTSYRNRYDNTFNKVVIPDGAPNTYGSVGLIGNNNGMFDVELRNSDGSHKSFIHKGIDLNQVNEYFKNNNSTIQSRANSIIGNTNIDGGNNNAYSRQLVQKDLGGKVYNNGGKMYASDGLQVEDNKFDQISPSFIKFTGPSHEKGGVDISFSGENVEVEGDETAAKTASGGLTIFGNMTVPGTKMKFKTAGKKLANKETQAIKQNVKGEELLEESNPANRFERLSYNAGILKTKGAETKLSTVHEQKEFLADLQQTMLDVADYNNLDPEAMSNGQKRKAKKGMTMKAPDGKTLSPTIEKIAKKYDIPVDVLSKLITQESGFNPNAISGKGAKGVMQFMPSTAKSMGLTEAQLTSNKPEDIEANIDAGAKYLSQLRKQNNGDITLALAAYNGGQKAVDFVKTSTGKKTLTGQDFVDFYSNRRESSPTDKPNAWQNQTLDYVNNIMDINPGESQEQVNKRLGNFNQSYYSNSPTAPDQVVIGEPPSWVKGYEDPLNPPTNSSTPIKSTNQNPTYNWDFSVPESNPPSNITKLGVADYAPELYSIATNRPSFVPAQKYTPQLYQPYQVSFQDRINENNYNFNALEDTLSDNPAALSTLSGQLYSANNAVRGEEFRTNQGINNEIINKNIALGNEAQLQNLQILDNQYVRQEQARSNTRRDTQTALNSLSSKVLQHDFENKTLAAYENMSNYRMVDTNNDGIPDRTTYFGPEYTPPTVNSTGTNYNSTDQTQEIQYRNYPESSVRRDAFGIPITSTIKDEYKPITRGTTRKKKAGGNLQKKFNEQFGRK